MDWFASIVSSLNNVLWSYVLIGLLICVGLWFTFCTRFVQITNVREMFRCVLEGSRTPRPEGHISPFQAFCISTASRVGVGNIAGSFVTDGKITRNASVRITREGEKTYEGPIASLKRFKDEVKEVKAGYECGLVFEKFNDIQEGDIIEAYEMVEVPR